MGIPSQAASFLSIFIVAISSLPWVSSSSCSASSCCLKASNLFFYPLQSQCPFSISPTPPVPIMQLFKSSHKATGVRSKVDGDILDRVLTSNKQIGYTCVLFYASWCHFSQNLLPTFETLSFMFPQIQHLMVEQSSAVPSVLSRYGIHSFPSILIVNQTTTQRYSGPKSGLSLVQFYKRTTGLEPDHYHEDSQLVAHNNENSIIERFNIIKSVKVMVEREPYLVFSVIFLTMKMALFLLPRTLSQLKAFWFVYVPRLNLEIFGETSYVVRRILDAVDMSRIWAKLRPLKTRNFQEGARNARIWASLALGESSSRSN